MARPAPSADSQDLAAFGYRQELDRSLGSFSSFAAGFSYISILTGVFQLFYLGFDNGGPAFFWAWPAVFLGQFLVALCFAELAAHYPLAGSVYQWSKQIGHRAVGWMAGWVALACSVISLAAVALALKTPLLELLAGLGVLGADADLVNRAGTAVALGCLLIAFTTLVNVIGVRLLARINNLGVFTELFGVLLLIVLLAANARRGPAVVLDTQGRGEGREFGYLGALLAAALMPSYVLYGFDTAGLLAEETTNPRRKAPRAILQALAAAGLAGGLLLLTALMAVDNPAAPQLGQPAHGLFYVVEKTLPTPLGKMFTLAILLAITVCALAVHTGTGRLMFAMARDNNLPFARRLARVSPRSRAPTVPVLAAGLGAALILTAFANSEKLTEIVAGVAILWANLAYLLVTFPLLVHRFRGWPENGGPRVGGLFALGKWGVAVNFLAVGWGMVLIVNVGWPRLLYGEEWYERYSALLLTAGLLAVGGAYYGLVQRHKTALPGDKPI
jgi:urea carboxylase system permease